MYQLYLYFKVSIVNYNFIALYYEETLESIHIFLSPNPLLLSYACFSILSHVTQSTDHLVYGAPYLMLSVIGAYSWLDLF